MRASRTSAGHPRQPSRALAGPRGDTRTGLEDARGGDPRFVRATLSLPNPKNLRRARPASPNRRRAGARRRCPAAYGLDSELTFNLPSFARLSKLAYDHNIKAESIPEQPFVNPEKSVYGMFYMINGDAASQSHFYVTDSLNHFVTGSLYFKAKPNFDSIYPAVVYLREDIRKIMETIEWK